MSTVFRLLLLAGLLVCAVATALVKKPLRAVIIYICLLYTSPSPRDS